VAGWLGGEREKEGMERAVSRVKDVQESNPRGKQQIDGTKALASRLLVVALSGERERGQRENKFLRGGRDAIAGGVKSGCVTGCQVWTRWDRMKS
jgi:hypothetical protein